MKLVSIGIAGPGFLIVGSGVTIQGFDISGYVGSSECAAGVQVSGRDADVRNNRVHDSIFGICAFFGTDFRIHNNVTDANLAIGIVLQRTTGGEVTNNTTRNNGQTGIGTFNVSLNGVGIDLLTSTGFTLTPGQRLAQYHGGLPMGRIGHADLPEQHLQDRDPGRRLGLIARTARRPAIGAGLRAATFGRSAARRASAPRGARSSARAA